MGALVLERSAGSLVSPPLFGALSAVVQGRSGCHGGEVPSIYETGAGPSARTGSGDGATEHEWRTREQPRAMIALHVGRFEDRRWKRKEERKKEEGKFWRNPKNRPERKKEGERKRGEESW